jgi:predicted dehydrogenase
MTQRSTGIIAGHESMHAQAPDARVVGGRLDGLPSGVLDDLRRHVTGGGSLLIAPEPDDAVAAELAGVAVAGAHPAAEWFVTLMPVPEAARLDREVPLSATLRTFTPLTEEVRVAATAGIAMRDRPVITVRSVGAGRVVASGIADLERVIAHPTVGRFVGRLLRRDPPDARGEIGVAIVGYGPYGGMGFTHGLACAETDGLRLVAVVDTAPERLVAAAADFPEMRVYPDATSLVGDAGVELVIVATPPASHASLALELLRAGRHVVLEKPMCLTTADADRLIAEAERLDRTLTVHQSRRWDRDFLALREIVSGGRIGEVFNVETFVGGFDHPCRLWHSDELVSGGAIFDWGSHHVDWVLRLYGSPPARVIASAHARVWHDVTNADQVTVWMRWADGREATFRQSELAAIRRPKFYVQGTAGTIEGHYRPLVSETVEPGRGYAEHAEHHAEAPVALRVARYDGPGRLVEEVVPPTAGAGWAFHRNLADHLLLGEPLAVPPEESRDVVAVLEAAHRSAAAGGIPIDLG